MKKIKIYIDLKKINKKFQLKKHYNFVENNVWKVIVNFFGVGYRYEILKQNNIKFFLGKSHPIFIKVPQQIFLLHNNETEVTFFCKDKNCLMNWVSQFTRIRNKNQNKGIFVKILIKEKNEEKKNLLFKFFAEKTRS